MINLHLEIHELFEQHTSSELIAFVKNNIFIYAEDCDSYIFEPNTYLKMVNDTSKDHLNRIEGHRFEMLNKLNMVYQSFKDGFTRGYDIGYGDGYSVGYDTIYSNFAIIHKG